MFRTNRGLLKFLLLSLITFGIYGIVVMTHISMEIDTIASPRDHKNTMNYLGYEFGAGDFWGWGVLGSLILIGPFVFLHKLLKSMNLINESYNASL